MTDHVDEERAHAQREHNTCQHLVPSRERIDSQCGECLRDVEVSEAGPYGLALERYLQAGPNKARTSRIALDQYSVLQLLRGTVLEAHGM